MKTFQEWALSKDIFGFEKGKTEEVPQKEGDRPLRPFDSQIIMKELLRHPIGDKTPHWDWGDTITWGDRNLVEAIHVDVSPLGSFKVIMRKMIHNLRGEPTWICKKIHPLPEHKYRENEWLAAEHISGELKTINWEMDSPSQTYDLEKMTLKMIEQIKIRRPCNQMVYQGCRKKTENHYLIEMYLKAGGGGAPDNTRVEKFQITNYFDKEAGLVRVFGNNVCSPMSFRQWLPTPSEFDEMFAPTQKVDEIVDCICDALSTY